MEKDVTKIKLIIDQILLELDDILFKFQYVLRDKVAALVYFFCTY